MTTQPSQSPLQATTPDTNTPNDALREDEDYIVPEEDYINTPLGEQYKDRVFSFDSFLNNNQQQQQQHQLSEEIQSTSSSRRLVAIADDTSTNGDVCIVCNNVIKTTKSGSYRSDNFLKDYKALFPDFTMACGSVCYSCYYQVCTITGHDPPLLTNNYYSAINSERRSRRVHHLHQYHHHHSLPSQRIIITL
jgi:hypothetical protein